MSWEVLGNQLLLGELGDQKSYARVAWTVGMGCCGSQAARAG